MWNERFASPDYVYGTAPNDFLAEHAGLLKGPVLSLCEGEGRNGVFLASRGLEVLGVDGSAANVSVGQPDDVGGLSKVSTSLVWLTDDAWPSTLPGRPAKR